MLLAAVTVAAPQPAFPGAEGFGASSRGGACAEEAARLVLEGAGCSNKRDAVDVRILDDIRQMHLGRIVASQDDVGGWPELR